MEESATSVWFDLLHWLTRGSFSAARYVDTSCINMRILPASGEVSWQGHFEKVVGCVDAMIRQMQNTAKMIDSSFGLSERNFTTFCAGADMELSVTCCTTFWVSWHELTNSWRVSDGVFFKLNFWHDDVVGKDGPAIRANLNWIQRIISWSNGQKW